MEKIHAVFAVISPKPGFVWATTRPDGSLGLPGGKVDEGEHPLAAVRREAEEEGLLIRAMDQEIFHTATVEGKTVAWVRFFFCSARPMAEWKEKHRGIRPIAVPVAKVAAGFGNEFLLECGEVA
jgi:hypothetical protein